MLTNLATHYGWWLIALVLIGAELVVPGYFMLWIGIAAAVMGALVLIVPDMGALAQAFAFAVLAIISCVIYWKFVRLELSKATDQPLLNRRAEQYVGRRYVLDTAIVNGQGKARVGDSHWLVEGPDLPAGVTIEVVGVEGATLKVQPVA